VIPTIKNVFHLESKYRNFVYERTAESLLSRYNSHQRFAHLIGIMPSGNLKIIAIDVSFFITSLAISE